MVSKNTIYSDIWKIFYDRIKNTVTTQTLTNGSVITIKTYDSNYATKPLETNVDYPILVVNTPSLPPRRFTSGKDKIDGSILIELYTCQSESADKFISQIQDTIETYIGTLNARGIHRIPNETFFGELQTDMFVRGTIKVHVRRLPIKFRFYYTRTINY